MLPYILLILALIFFVIGVFPLMSKKSRTRTHLSVLGFSALLLMLAGYMSFIHDPSQASTPSKSKEHDTLMTQITSDQSGVNAESNERVPATVFDANGTYDVNTDIQPGLYRSTGGAIYWERSSNIERKMTDIITNGNPIGPEVVEIESTDLLFYTMGSGEWKLVDDSYHPKKLTSFSDGTYIVGADIDPGTYQSDNGVSYWVRLRSFTGALDDEIANGTPRGPVTVDILPTDKGFKSVGGGTWRKVD